MVWVWVPQHTTPLTHAAFFLSCVCAVAGCCLERARTYITPSLNHAGCVITISGVFSFLFL
jgi:hypothetical protein